MQRSSLSSLLTLLLYGGSGLLAGLCLVIMVAGLLVMQRAKNLPPASVATALSFDSPSTDTSSPLTQTPAPRTPSRTSQALLDQAENDLADGQAQQVIDTLLPAMDQFHTDADQALANEYLGQAEFQLGHFQFAAIYFDKAYTLQSRPSYLYELAAAYDYGGDLENALEKYQLLVQSTDPEADRYRSEAEQRIEGLYEVLGTPTPTINPQATAGLTRTAKPRPTPTLGPTPEGAVVIDLATGTGSLSLPADAYPVYCFRPTPAIEYQSVTSLAFRLIGKNKNGSADLQLYLWNSVDGGWGMVNLNWGDNPIDFAHRYVNREGEICVGLRNVSGQTVKVENAGFTLTIQKTDGSTAVYGLN